MALLESFIATLASAFAIWGDQEAHKYSDKLMELKKDFYAEYNKPPSARSDAVLDNIEFELRILAGSFTTSVSGASKPLL